MCPYLVIRPGVSTRMALAVDGGTVSNKTRQALRKALVALMKQQDFSRIQVKDVVEQAGIARATFYLHFKSKEELLLDYIDEMFETFFERIEADLIDASALDERVATRVFETFYAEKDFSAVLTQESVQPLLMNRFRGYMARIIGHMLRETRGFSPPASQLDYLISFWAGGSLLLIRQWVANDFQPSEEEMGQMYSKLTLSGMRALMEQV